MAGELDVMRDARGEHVGGEGWLGEVRAVAMAVWDIVACGGMSRLSEVEGVAGFFSDKRLMSVMNETDPPNKDVIMAFES